MHLLSPPQKLDVRFLYSYEEGISYLENLSEFQKKNYFYTELFDFWFMINYTWLSIITLKNYAPDKKNFFLAFLIGTMDFFETSFIAFYLYNREFSSAYRLLPIFSSLKWLLGILLVFNLGKMLLSRRAIT